MINNNLDPTNKRRSSLRKPASKRAIEKVQDTLDIEPIDTKEKSSIENQALNLNDIDDPW